MYPISNSNKYIIKYIPEFIVVETRVIRSQNICPEPSSCNDLALDENIITQIMYEDEYDFDINDVEPENDINQNSTTEKEFCLMNELQDPNQPQNIITPDNAPKEVNAQITDKTHSIIEIEKINYIETEFEKIQTKKTTTDSNKKFICDYCGKIFPQRTHLLNHKIRHEPHKWRQCKICFKRLPDGMSRHMKTHSNEKPYECDICNKYFKQLSLLKSHMEMHSDIIEDKYKCRYCDQKFRRRYLRKQHQKVHENRITPMKPSSQHVCAICGKISATWASNKLHLISHSTERPYGCNVCDAKFKTKGSLVVHLRIHTGERPFSCDVCGKSFIASSARDEHLRIHTGEKNFECRHCFKRFGTNSKLTKHLRVHTGEKPHKCTICGKRFTQKHAMISHMKQHTKVN